jgi:thymidine kinase
MFGGKSKLLIKLIGWTVDSHACMIIIKPEIDTRDGANVVSRDSRIMYSAETWNEDYKTKFLSTLELKPIRSVFIDESHFLSLDDVIFINEACKKYEVDLYFSGLETDFKEQYFESSLWLKENTHFYVFKHGKCNCCNKNIAVYNILLDSDGNRVTDGDSIHVGDSEYIVLCEKCIRRL